MTRRTTISIKVDGPPVREQDFTSYGDISYRLTGVRLRLSFSDGNWSTPRWDGYGCRVKKDGTVGTARGSASYDFEPDSETRGQFLATARKQVRGAATQAMRAGA